MKRRSFLKGLVGVIGAGIAPIAGATIKALEKSAVTEFPTGWTVSANGDIRYEGSPDQPRVTVLEFHRWLQNMSDRMPVGTDDPVQLDILSQNPSDRQTDHIIMLKHPYNIDDQTSEHLYEGSLRQKYFQWTDSSNNECTSAQWLSCDSNWENTTYWYPTSLYDPFPNHHVKATGKLL